MTNNSIKPSSQAGENGLANNTEDEAKQLNEERVKIASTETKSGDEVVHIAWLADGIDLWNRSNGKFGHSPEDARRYIISSVTRLIRTEKLKLLAEVREQTTIFKIKSHDKKGQPHLYEAGRGVPTEVVDKLEAEL